MRLFLLFSLLLFSLSSCMFWHNYSPPENNVCDNWSAEKDAKKVLSNETPLSSWWKVFNDPLLTKYIEKAAENNFDVLAAQANIWQARALRQVTASSLFPQINADLNASKSYFSKNGPLFSFDPSSGNAPGTISNSTGLPFSVQVPQIQSLYNALFDASWELDFFGKIRRSVEAAEATIGVTIEDLNDILITVFAEIARNYMEVRSNQKLYELVKENITLLEEKVKIIESQFENGYVDLLNVEDSLTDLSTERSKLPHLNAEIYRGIYTLSILIGDMPEALIDEMICAKPLPSPPKKVSVGVRSDLLRRRPDIRRSERQLANATANVGVAIASFFPTITLFGDGGFQSLMIKNLFTAGSRTWAFGGDLLMPIFQGGRLVGNLKASRAVACQAAYFYQKTVLNALEETESLLTAYADTIAATKQIFETTTHNQNLVFLSEERYKKGLVNKLDFLDSKWRLNETEQSLTTSQTTTLIDLISLYKALGGGWESEDLCTESP